MSTPFGRVACDFITRVLLFQQAGDEQRPNASTLRAQWESELQRFVALAVPELDPARSDAEMRAHAEHLARQAEDARFALATFADEVVLRSSYGERAAWSKLQTEIHDQGRGGNEFYERLERLGAEDVEAREIFYYCLAFGFQGALQEREADRQTLMAHHLNLLRQAGRARDPVSAQPVAPRAYEVELDPPPASSGTGRLLLLYATGTAAGFGLLWLGLRLALPEGA